MTSTDPSSPTRAATRLDGVRHFPGIPYARPVTGGHRFQPPAPCADGTPPAASGERCIAPQNPSRLRGVMGDFEARQSEDCLQLSIWTPQREGPPRAVLLWLHGGAFVTGGGALDWYDGAQLCREGDVVVVNVNYRLGALGFLRWPGVSEGNLGLLDAEAALHWVRQHIADFGGDPARITLMGQSAGAWLAALMVARMPVQPVPAVQRLILMSAPLGVPLGTPQQAAAIADAFTGALQARMGQRDAARALRTAEPAALLAAKDEAVRAIGLRFSAPGHPPVAFGLVGDGQTLPAGAAYEELLAQAAARVPVLVGWTRDEMHAFALPPALPVDPALARVGHSLFGAPALRWAEAAARAGQTAFAFRFDAAAPGNPIGACHCIELPFVFGSFAAFAQAPMLAGAALDDWQALGRRVRAAWLAFAVHGHPDAAGGAGLPPWPAYAAERPGVMHIDVRSAVHNEPRLASEPAANEATPS